jgi:hypothetical protein
MKATKLLIFCIIIINSFSSCYQDTGDFFRNDSISIFADIAKRKPNEIIILTITTDAGTDVTKDADIYIREKNTTNEQKLADDVTTITSATEITYIVYAKYKLYKNSESFREYKSEEIEIKFDENAQSFAKRVLIEDYTGAWCVNCPTVSYAIDLLKNSGVRAVPVAIHRGANSASYDPYHFTGADPLEELVGVANQYPTAKLNRLTNWNYPQHTATNQNKAKQLTEGELVEIGLAMNSSIVGNNINLDVKVKFFNDYSNLKLVVYALENNLIYPQKNSTSFYGGLSVITDFKHDHVVRATFTDILGDAIPSSETSYGKTYSRNFSVAVPSNISNTANMEFVAFVIGSDNKSINVRSAAIGVNQEFEEN